MTEPFRHPKSALAVLVALLVTGCTSSAPSSKLPPRPAPVSSGGIDEMHLFGSPVALRLHGSKVPNGLAVSVYANNSRVARGLAINEGTLEVLMFDSVLKPGDAVKQTPLHVWSFAARDLAKLEAKTSLGTGYRLVLEWGEDKPRSNSVTLVARYQTKGGTPVYSTPNAISVSSK